ncbi:MAG: hypothetical protein ACREOG_16185 [Gemmatimonadaceae bacterium]
MQRTSLTLVRQQHHHINSMEVRMTVSRLLMLVPSLSLILACAPTRAPGSSAALVDPAVARDLERVRAATAPYRDLAAAQAAGYPTATPPCLSSPADGAMGHHYVNRAHVDDKLELERPEILLYAPSENGKMRLTGVEYIIPYRILPPESQPPRIFGQDLKRSDGLKLWYLHVWAWEENSAGLFADWNPAVKC